MTVIDEEHLLDKLESSANAITMELDAGYSFQQFLFGLEPSQVNLARFLLSFHGLIPDRSSMNILS